MTILYNRHTQEALDFEPEAVAAALGTGHYVATLGETVPGAIPEPPPIPPYSGGGVTGDTATQPILDYPVAADPVEDGDWFRFHDVSSGLEKRLTRAQLLAGVSAGAIAWANITGKPSEFPPTAHEHDFAEITNLPDILAELVNLSDTGYLHWDGTALTATAGTGGGGSVDWQAVPEAVRSIVPSTGGAGPSDSVPLILWQSADGLYAIGIRWKTNGSSSLFHRWNGVEYTPFAMPARASIGGGPVQTTEFHLGAEFTPANGATPATGGMHAVVWGPQARRWRWLAPDSFDPAALRAVLAGPAGEQTNVRVLQPAGSYFGFYAADSYSATAIPAFAVQHVAGEANGLQAVGAVAGQAPKIQARGADANIDAVIEPKGTGGFRAPDKVGFGVSPVAKQTLTGDLQGSAGAKAIAVALAAIGMMNDATTLGTVPGAWLSGTGAPDAGVGADGQMYLDRATGYAYGPKAGGAWPVDYSDLNGPQGVAGAGYAADANVPVVVNFGRAGQTRVVPSNSTTYTSSGAEAGLTLTQTAATNVLLVGPSLPVERMAGLSVIVEAKITTGLTANTGLFIGTQGFTWGGTADSTGRALTWRSGLGGSNGSLVAYKVDNTSDATLTISPGSMSGGTFAANDVLKMVLRFTSANTATLTLFKNGVQHGQTFAIGGWPEGKIWCGFRGNTAGQAGIITRFEVRRQADQLVLHCDPAAAAPGLGTAASPFPTLEAAQLESAALGARDLVLRLAAGSYYGRGIDQGLSGAQFLDVIGPGAGYADIYGAVMVSSGWTSVGGGVWSRPFAFNDQVEQTNGGVIDPTRPSADGRQSFTVYNRATPNTAPGGLTEGQYSVSVTGADTLYLYPYDGVDPNTKTLALAYRPNCLKLGGNSSANWQYAKARNLRLFYSYASGFEADRSFIDLFNVVSVGSAQTSGFQFVECAGKVSACRAEGNYNDGFAGVAGAGSATGMVIEITNCEGLNQVVGDGLSAHAGGPAFKVIGGRYANNGKCGLVDTGGGVDARNVLAENNADANFSWALNPAVGTTYQGRALHCTSKGGLRGFALVTSVTGSAGVLRLDLMGSVAFGAASGDLYLAQANGVGRKAEMVADVTGFLCGTVSNTNATIVSVALTQPAAA